MGTNRHSFPIKPNGFIRFQKDGGGESNELQEILSSGYASASISSNGGSKSYTRADADKITKAIITLQKELYQLNALLRNAGTDPFEIKKILHVYC